MISAKIVLDSINPCGNRLTTFELTYPRFVHAQFMTHRMFSRNAASSRAIPTKRMIRNILESPVEPVHWGKNQPGMKADAEVENIDDCKGIWHTAMMSAVASAEKLRAQGVHKQIVNRLLEPWMDITVICTATEYANFFHLRGADAQPEIAELASKMRDLYDTNTPADLDVGAWHLPYLDLSDKDEGLYSRSLFGHDEEILCQVSTARCARVSYLTQDGERDPEKDIDLYQRLETSGHWSPFEHVAQALPGPYRSGNFVGWHQYRKQFAGENAT